MLEGVLCGLCWLSITVRVAAREQGSMLEGGDNHTAVTFEFNL